MERGMKQTMQQSAAVEICSTIARLTRMGYEVRIKPMEQFDLSILAVTAVHPRKNVYVMQKGMPRDLVIVVQRVFEMVEREEKENAN
jgi:hypothetical protein